MNKEIVVATDGSALGNPGPAGWCWYVDDTCWAAGGTAHATNNLMEIMAVNEFLKSSQDLADTPVEIQADSKYVIDALTVWIHTWQKNGWKNSNRKPVANKDLFLETFNLMSGRTIRFTWIKGHRGHVLNEAADARAHLCATHAKAGKVRRLGPA